jgi:hypothetical protein
MKATFISWEHYNRRSDLLAQHLGASLHNIVVGQRGRFLQAPARYVAEGIRTWRVLRAEQPDVILVQNPPIFAAVTATIYARRYGARVVIDSHTSQFVAPRWRWSVGLHRILSRWAAVTIVHNRHQEEIVRGWGVPTLTIGFVPGAYPAGTPFPFGVGFNVAVVSSFEWDEPLDVVFEAAGRLPHVHFYVTGDARRATPALLSLKPANCTLTGYLPYDQYVGLLRGAGAVLDLVTADHTLLLGAFEAVSLETPLIISDWPILRDYFPIGALHTPNTVEGVVAAVGRAQVEQGRLRAEVGRLRRELDDAWALQRVELERLLRREAGPGLSGGRG